ncbi:MAG TPA: DUF2304 domain-containing protein [Chitinivibrionales bacterium]|nr:DUF2304 domain-containing protein [Chitinivibrionales bacterium]
MEITITARIIFGATSILITAFILYFIGNNSIKEKYSLLWLPLAFLFLFFGLFPNLLVKISSLIHLHYITVILLCVIFIFTCMLLYLTIRLSSLREDVKKLAQEISIFKAKKNAA